MRVRLKVHLRHEHRRDARPAGWPHQPQVSAGASISAIATQPTIHGENMVLRILDRRRASVHARSAWVLAEAHLHQLKLMMAQPQGIILVTGPTGSGKTTTLYSC